ncbi:MAG: patatin-like phospholipase family protein [Candidatus Shapirobacteria bacterium]|jgi:NTE family protein
MFSIFKKPPVIGLALGSGGARGLAHIGVIRSLLENDIYPGVITGSSAGALIGGLYSAFGRLNEINKIVDSIDYRFILKLILERPSKQGVVRGNKLESFINEQVGSLSVENTKIPFYAVASDLVSGQPYVFKKGPLSIAIRASISIPLFFSPVKLANTILVDGGASVPVPVDIARQNGADFVIGVNLYKSYFPLPHEKVDKSNISKLAFYSSQIVLNSLSQENNSHADFPLDLEIPIQNTLDFVKAKKFVDMGYEQTQSKIRDILKKLYK